MAPPSWAIRAKPVLHVLNSLSLIFAADETDSGLMEAGRSDVCSDVTRQRGSLRVEDNGLLNLRPNSKYLVTL